MLCSGCDVRFDFGLALIDEELAAEILKAPERPGCHRHPTPALALAVEHGEDEGHAGALAGKASDHLRPPPRLAEGALDQVGVPAPLPVFLWKAQVDGETLEVGDETVDSGGIGLLPLGSEAVHPPSGLLHRCLARRLLDVVEDLPPVRLEGVLIGSRDFGHRISQAMDDAP